MAENLCLVRVNTRSREQKKEISGLLSHGFQAAAGESAPPTSHRRDGRTGSIPGPAHGPRAAQPWSKLRATIAS